MLADSGERLDGREAPAGSLADAQTRRPPVHLLGRGGVLPAYLGSLVELGGWPLLGSALLMVLTSLTEGLGVVLLFPVLAVAGMDMAGQGHVGHYTAEAQALLARSGLERSLWLPVLLIIFLLLMTLRSLFLRLQSVWTLNTVLQYEMRLSCRFYEAIVRAEWRFLSGVRSSDLTHALTAEMTRVSAAVYQSMAALASLILAVVYAVIAFKLSTATTLMVLVAGALLLVLSRKWLNATHQSGQAVSATTTAIYSAATEHLENLKTIKAYGAQRRDVERFRSLERSAIEQSLRGARSQAAAVFWFEAGSLVVLAAIVFVSLRYLGVGSASILLLLAIFTRLMPRMAAGNTQLQAFLADLPAFENVMSRLRECEKHAEPVSAEAEIAPDLTQEIRLEDVSFQYAEGSPVVLDRVTMTLKAGEITAIVGASGAGKSTIADLVNGLLEPGGGRILIGGTELDRATVSNWRGRVGYVAPDTVLFHDTVRANLLWSRPDAAEGDLHEALRSAAAGFAFDLPFGLDTVVGDRGVLLSNGQRQRLALARALLRKPSLLILDEATNSLDIENERRILDAIEGLKGRTTVLLIAHRAAVVERASVVYVLEHGRTSVVSGQRLSSRSVETEGGLELNTAGEPFFAQ